MCELFAISSRIKTSIYSSLLEFSQHGGKTGHHCDGWGIAEYEGLTARIHKEPQAAAFSQELTFLRSHHRSTHCAICHIRHATVGEVALRNTQPFITELNGCSHVFAHNGDLKNIEEKFILTGDRPAGETDSEYAFYYLMSFIKKLWHQGVPDLQKRSEIVERVFTELATLGPANFVYSDGDYLYAFANKRIQPNGKIEPPGMYWLTRQCCENNSTTPYSLYNSSADIHQQVVLFSSVPLTSESWQPIPSGKLLVTKNGNLLSTFD